MNKLTEHLRLRKGKCWGGKDTSWAENNWLLGGWYWGMKEYPYAFPVPILSRHLFNATVILFFFFFKLVHNVHAYISHLEMHISNSNTKTTQEECIISEKKKTRQHSCYCSISKYKTDYHNAASVCIVRQVHFVCVWMAWVTVSLFWFLCCLGLLGLHTF